MPKHPNESNIQLLLEKNLKTENKQSQTELTHLPNEILAEIFGHLSASEIGKARRVSTQFNQVITTQYHGPRSSDFNNYLNLFPDNKGNTALTYYDYFEKVKAYKELFLEKQFLEIQVIQKNLADCDDWRNVSPELKKEILQIEGKDINHMEAKRIEALLDDIHVEIIKSKIDLQSWFLSLACLNLTRLPKALFTDNELQEFWQTLKILILEGNQLTTLPAEISGLQALTTLFLSRNQLTSLPAEIGRLQALMHLSINNNQLTSLPAEIGGLQELRDLALHENQLTSLPIEIGRLQACINLNHNQLTSETLGWLGQRFGANFVQRTIETQTYPNIAQAEELSNRNSPRP